jgi:hypothetical protein
MVYFWNFIIILTNLLQIEEICIFFAFISLCSFIAMILDYHKKIQTSLLQTFDRGSINKFILSVDEPLGPLSYIRIWHDNEGVGKLQGWYLSKVVVRELQDMEQVYVLNLYSEISPFIIVGFNYRMF